MSIEDRTVYVIESGPALAVAIAYEAEWDRKNELICVVTKKYRCKSVYRMGRNTEGLVFKGEPKRKYLRAKKVDGEWYAKPDVRYAEGRTLRKELDEIQNLARSSVFAGKVFDGDAHHVVESGLGMMFYDPSIGKIGNTWIVTKHKDNKAKPIDGAHEIKHSEYFTLKEAAEEKRAA